MLVTGGKGFIGSCLVNRLNKLGHNVKVLDIKDGNDIRNKALVEKFCENIDIIFHLASKIGTNKLFNYEMEAEEVNVIGTLNILSSAYKNKSKVIMLHLPDVNWLNVYKITKDNALKYCELYNKHYGLDVIFLRVFNVYGPDQSLEQDKIVPTLIKQAINNETLTIYGDGEQSSDYIYVEDLVDALISVIEKNLKSNKIIDIGSGEKISVNKMANIILELSGSNSSKKYLSLRKGEKKAFISADIKLAKNLLDFKTKTSLEEGIKKTIEYYKTKVY